MLSEDLEKHFKTQLEDHEAFDLDGAAVWQSLNERLDDQKSKRKIFLGFKLMEVVSLLVVMFTMFFGMETEEHILGCFPIEEHSTIAQPLDVDKSFNLIDTVQTSIMTPSPLELNDPMGQGSETTHSSLQQTIKQVFVTEAAVKDNRIAEGKEKLLNQRPQKTTSIAYTVPPISVLPLRLVANLDEPNIGYPSYTAKEKEIENAIVYLGVEYGLTSVRQEIKGTESTDYAELRKNTEEPQLGWQIGGHIYRINPSGIVLGTGLRYQENWIKFNHEWTYQDQQNVEDLPIHILIDSESEDTMGVLIGNAIVDQMNERKLQHHNRFQRLSVPIDLGYMQVRPRLTYGIMGSLQINYLLKQDGRILSEAERVLDVKEEKFFKQWTASLALKPIVSIPLKSVWQFSLSPSVSISLTDQLSGERSISQKDIHYGLSIGLYRNIGGSKIN